MQCLTLKENFIFSSQIKLNIEHNNSESSETVDSILLTTINALYMFKKNDSNKSDEFLENKLLLKCLHDDIYVEKFKNDSNEIKYTSDGKNDLKFSIKIEHPLAKEYVKILALFEGWKLAEKNAVENKMNYNYKDNYDQDNENIEIKSAKKSNKGIPKELFPKRFFLFQIIDSFIQNNFVFQIDYLILQLYKDYPYFMEQFFYVITIFPKIEINLILDEQLSDIFPLLFPSDNDSIKENIPTFNLKYSLIHLSLKSIYLKDSFAEKILPPLIVKSPFLQTLDLSHNFLTNKIFPTLIIKGFFNVHLKNLNLSYNQLSSDNLSKHIFQISKQFLRITLFDLRGNKIDNRFLNNFNPKVYEELRNIIQDKLQQNNNNNVYSKELIVFDLRETNINIDKTSFRLYLKKKRDLSNHLEIKNSFNDNYETKFSGLDSVNFIFDVYFFKKNVYKYNNCSRSKTKLNIDVKNFQLKLPYTINDKQIVKFHPYNNWFYTGYYDKEEEKVDSKVEGKSNELNNDKKKTKNEDNKGKKKEEEIIKYKNEGIQRKNKKNNSQKISKGKTAVKKSVENSSKVVSNDPDSIFAEPAKIILEENSDSDSNSKGSDNNQQNKKEEKKSNDESDEENKKSKGKSSGDQKENNDNQEEKEKENNNINNEKNDEKIKEESPNKEEKSEGSQKENEKVLLYSDEEQNQGDNKMISPKKTNENRNNDTIIITKTDDELSEEEGPIPKMPKATEISKSKENTEVVVPTATKKSKKKGQVRNRNTLFEKNVDFKKINQAKKCHELDLYRELFKFFFLCDYYFDPILNSFATKMPQGIKRDKSYMNARNEAKRYEALKDYINIKENKKNSKKYKFDEYETLINELFINDAKQMYYDYMNLLRIKNSEVDRVLTTKTLLISIFKNITKNSVNIFRSDKKFNPNGLIEHMTFFYLYLASPHDYRIKIPLTTLNKLISRIKLESLLCLKEKSHHALGTLSKITSGLDISVKTQVNSVFIQLTEKAKLILRGLLKVLNFDGYNEVDNVKGFLFETGNFLDIFLEKADSINLANDLVILCKYIQYWRNNYIRNLIYNLMHEISKKEGTTRGCDMTEEFAKANEDFKNTPLKNMGLTKDINYPEFAQHPSNVDYLYFSEKPDLEFEKDLKNITRYIKADQTYFRRNLYDRINFLFCTTSRNRKNKTNTYSLHRGNTYLKVMRILFRYNNNLDYKKLEKKMKNINKDYIIESSLNINNLNSSYIQNCKIFNNMTFDRKLYSRNSLFGNDIYFDVSESLSKIAIEESYLRVIDFPDDENVESEITKRDKKKIRLLLHSDNYNQPETLLDLSLDKKMTEEQIKLFTETTKVFNSKCQEQMTNLDKVTNPMFITIVQNYIKYFLIIKGKFRNDRKLWEYQNLECFYQLYRFANINNFSYKKEKNEVDYAFVFLTIMCFYFEFSVPMIKRVKGMAYYLFTNLSHRKNCKTIIRALNNPFRYDWIMSTMEIYRKIDNSPFNVCVNYPSNDGSFKEDFVITETTTASELMKDILKNSKVLKDSKEKDFYWIYYKNKEEPWKYQYINHEQVLVQLIAEEEQNEVGENDMITNVIMENNFNDENSLSSKNNESNAEEKKEKFLENYCEQKTFRRMIFEVKRRIFTQNLLNGNIESYNYFEKELLYNQIKNIIFSSEIVDYTWSGIGEKIAVACHFEEMAEKKRQLNLKRANDLESRISSSRIVTKFNMNMNDLETLPLFDKSNDINISSKEESFVTEHNLTYNNKDKMSLGLNSYGSANNKMTYKSYAYNAQKNSYGSNNMDIIKEEDDDENNVNNSFNRDSINTNKEEEEENKVVNLEDLDKEISFPSKLKAQGQTVKLIYKEMASKIKNLSDPKKIFFDLVKERPILMANNFEVNNKQSNESFPEKFLISLNLDKVSFLQRTNYTKFFEFKYEEIIKCLILDNYILLLIVNVFKDEIDQRTEVILKLESTDNRFIMEDILTYCQLFLATKTKSQYVHITNNCVSFLGGYKVMFDRLLPFRITFPSPNEINKKEIEKMRELLHNNEAYKKYKEEKAKKKEEEIKESQKGKLDIKSMQNIMRFNEFDEELDSDESEESVKVIPLNLNKVEKKEEKKEEINNNKEENKEEEKKEEEKKEEVKEEIKEEEKEPEKTEEEKKQEEEMKKKVEENELKRKEVDKVLSKALLDFQFDTESENKESEEF